MCLYFSLLFSTILIIFQCFFAANFWQKVFFIVKIRWIIDLTPFIMPRFFFLHILCYIYLCNFTCPTGWCIFFCNFFCIFLLVLQVDVIFCCIIFAFFTCPAGWWICFLYSWWIFFTCPAGWCTYSALPWSVCTSSSGERKCWAMTKYCRCNFIQNIWHNIWGAA